MDITQWETFFETLEQRRLDYLRQVDPAILDSSRNCLGDSIEHRDSRGPYLSLQSQPEAELRREQDS